MTDDLWHTGRAALEAAVLHIRRVPDEVLRTFDYPQIDQNAIVQAHCHHQSIMHMHAEEVVMDRPGLHWDILDSGCCGVAGSFGFEAGDKYDVSMRAGERHLAEVIAAGLRGTGRLTP